MPERVPRLVADVDIRRFKLDPTDGFLLTRIDGRVGFAELVRETGLPDESIERALTKLEKLGIIEIVEPGAPPKNVLPPPPPKKPELPAFTESLSGPKYDPAELDEQVDLTFEAKKRILDLYYRLEDMDHYTLLGITREVDKKGVKRAYFELAAMMHPDRYFKKNLGSFKSKMEILFGRVTEAHDTLVDPAKRAEYDAYIAEVATTRGMEAMLERALEESRKAAEASSAMVAAPATAAPASGAPAAPSPSSLPEAEMRARREALARRLLGGSVRPPSASQPAAAAPSPLRYSSAADAVDALKRRYEARIESATAAQVKKFLETADEAAAKKDVVGEANALGMAVKLAPDDADLAVRYQEVKNAAQAQLVESYTKQATYEERSAHWQDAARSWQKVARIAPTNAHAHERAAYAILRADGDLRQAAEHAKQAVSIAPDVVRHHVTLAEIYAKAGLVSSAKRAAETGLRLDPSNKTLATIAKLTPK